MSIWRALKTSILLFAGVLASCGGQTSKGEPLTNEQAYAIAEKWSLEKALDAGYTKAIKTIHNETKKTDETKVYEGTEVTNFIKDVFNNWSRIVLGIARGDWGSQPDQATFAKDGQNLLMYVYYEYDETVLGMEASHYGESSFNELGLCIWSDEGLVDPSKRSTYSYSIEWIK